MSFSTTLLRFLVRGGTASAVSTLNEVPLAREIEVETDTARFKIGDGSTHYSSLPYANLGKVDFTGLADGWTIKWNAGSGKWVVVGAGVVAGSSSSGAYVLYNGTVQAAGKWDGGTSNPAHTTRLNYDGYLYATRLVGTHFGDGSNLTGISGAALSQNTLPYAVQTIAMRGSWAYSFVNPAPATVTSSTFGIDPSVGTVAGTGSTVSVTATSAYTRQVRRAYTSSSAAGSSTGVYITTALCSGLGGYYFATRFGIADAAAVANARLFVGIRASTAAPTNADPSSLTNIVCVGADTGDTNLQVIYNDGSGTASKIDLGASFPANTRSTDFYEVQILCLPGGTSVQVYVLNVATGASALNVLTTDIPATTTMLDWAFIRNNGTTALATKLEVGGWVWGINLEP